MSFDLGNDTIVRVRAPLVRNSRDNSEYRDWAAAGRKTYTRCMVQPFLPSNRLLLEDNKGREFQQEPMRVYVPTEDDFVFTDRVEYRGKSYDITTDPAPWTGLTGVLEFWTFVMRLRTG